MSGGRYPFSRTTCACRRCSISCEHLPGSLAPSDLPAIAAHLGFAGDLDRFAREHLVASEGPTVALGDGRIVTLPVLTPTSTSDGACRYYDRSTDGGRCTIHAVSPFGCAHVDAHMPEEEFARRTDALYAELRRAHERNDVYAQLTARLRALGRSAPPIQIRKARLRAALQREGLLDPPRPS